MPTGARDGDRGGARGERAGLILAGTHRCRGKCHANGVHGELAWGRTVAGQDDGNVCGGGVAGDGYSAGRVPGCAGPEIDGQSEAVAGRRLAGNVTPVMLKAWPDTVSLETSIVAV